MGYSALAESYREANFHSGHARGCGWGAGADCSCPKGMVTLFFVSAVLSAKTNPRSFILYYSESKDAAVEYARGAVAKGWTGVRCRKHTFHYSDDDYYEFTDRADMDRARIDDWSSESNYF